jgi:O-antigen/teichoic acid export membrane protein
MSDAPELSGSRPRISTSQAAGVLVLGNVLATLAEVVVPLVIVRLVGKGEVATLMSLLLIYNTTSLIVLTGFPSTVTYFLPGKARAERAAIARRVIGTMMWLGVAAGVLLFLIGRFGHDVLSAVSSVDPSQLTSLEPLMIVALVPLGDLPARVLPNLLVVENRPRPAAGYGVLRSLGMSLATLLPVSLGFNAWAVAEALVVLAVIELLYLQWQLRRLYGGVPRVPPTVSVGQLFRFGVPLGLTDIVSVLNHRFGAFVILSTFADVAFAEYQAGGWQIPIVTQVPYLVGAALAPRMVELFRAGEAREAIAIWRQSIGKVSILVVPVTLVFVVAADDLVAILFTPEYARAADVLRWSALMGVGRVAAFGTVIVSAGRPRFVLQAAVLSLLSNVVISLPLLWWLGFIGPAMGMFFAFVPMVVYYCWCIARASGLALREIFPLVAYTRVLAVALVGVGGAVVFRSMFDWSPVPSLLAQAAIVLGIFSALGSALGIIAREDWSFAWGWIRLKMLRQR